MQRDNFACIGCGSATKTLHVHHSNGYRNIEPWEYGDNELKTLCVDCHDAEHTFREVSRTVTSTPLNAEMQDAEDDPEAEFLIVPGYNSKWLTNPNTLSQP